MNIKSLIPYLLDRDFSSFIFASACSSCDSSSCSNSLLPSWNSSSSVLASSAAALYSPANLFQYLNRARSGKFNFIS